METTLNAVSNMTSFDTFDIVLETGTQKGIQYSLFLYQKQSVLVGIFVGMFGFCQHGMSREIWDGEVCLH